MGLIISLVCIMGGKIEVNIAITRLRELCSLGITKFKRFRKAKETWIINKRIVIK